MREYSTRYDSLGRVYNTGVGCVYGYTVHYMLSMLVGVSAGVRCGRVGEGVDGWGRGRGRCGRVGEGVEGGGGVGVRS